MGSVSRWRDSGHLERAVETAGGQKAFDAAVAAMLHEPPPARCRRQRSVAELALADMIADAERLGLYDADPEDVKAALKAARQKPEA